jgi:hypothetical protein
VEWLASGNLAVRRDAFNAIGGFDGSLEACEDVDLCQRLRMTGGRLLSDGRMRSIHYGDPSTLRELFAGELWRGRDNLRVSLRPPRSLRTLASLAAPAAQLLTVILTVASLALGGTHALTLAAVAATAALGIAGLQAVRMLGGSGAHDPLALAQAFVVAGVFGLARGLALILRMPHGVRHPSPPASST